MYAEAIEATQSAKEALPVVEDALETMERHDERLYRTHAITLKGELLHQIDENRVGESETCFREAIMFARDESAKFWELRAATRLARLWHSQGKTTEADRFCL